MYLVAAIFLPQSQSSKWAQLAYCSRKFSACSVSRFVREWLQATRRNKSARRVSVLGFILKSISVFQCHLTESLCVNLSDFSCKRLNSFNCSSFWVQSRYPQKFSFFFYLFRGSIKNIHLYIFRKLNFVFSVLICRSSVFCILALGSGQRLLYQLGSGLGLVLVLRFCAYSYGGVYS